MKDGLFVFFLIGAPEKIPNFLREDAESVVQESVNQTEPTNSSNMRELSDMSMSM